jgi:D-alanine-D-alanine ligase
VLIGLTYNVKTTSPVPASIADEEEEFDSPETLAALAAAVESLGHDVTMLGDGEPMLRRLLEGRRPELVLNIAEGRGASRTREARVPAVLEMLGIPHTGSDPLTLAATLDKDCGKRLVHDAGVPTAPWALVEDGNVAAVEDRLDELTWPLFVKPAYEGSSKGVLAKSLVHDRRQLDEAVAELFASCRQPLLVEEFIDGEELTVGVLGNRSPNVLGVMRILPKQARPGPFTYNLEVKRDWERCLVYECPARISAADTAAVERTALACWRALGCRDVARFDYRLRAGVPYFLECNPLPGLSPKSGDLVFIARAAGIEHPQLIGMILDAALARMRDEVMMK